MILLHRGLDRHPALDLRSFQDIPQFTAGQILATAYQELQTSNYLTGLHLLMEADSRGVVPEGKRHPNEGLEPVLTVKDAKRRAVQTLRISEATLQVPPFANPLYPSADPAPALAHPRPAFPTNALPLLAMIHPVPCWPSRVLHPAPSFPP